MTDAAAGRPPDLVVVVLDCVRALSFPGTGASADYLPRLSEIQKESVTFTRASTVAPWTLPAHASLFTGRYPWEHGVMGEGRLRFDPAYPTVAGLLRPRGYASLALSANGMLAPLLALPGSFDEYRCAEWWEKTFRWLEPEVLRLGPESGSRGVRGGLSVLKSALSGRTEPRPHTDFLRVPATDVSFGQALRQVRPDEWDSGPWAESLSWAAIDGLNRIARVLRSPDDPQPLPIAPWIEGTLDAWLTRRPATQPVHCFLNLLDAHERYLSHAELVRGFGSWLRFTRVTQNARLWLEGKWKPTDSELDLLRRSYERTIRLLDRRLGTLVEVLRRAGRWENTLLVITSDHGQAFGEHNEMFHERSPYQPLLHVPLVIRWPGGNGGGSIREDVVGLTDIAPTLLSAAGATPPPGLPGRVLEPRAVPSQVDPVLGMADGFPCTEHYRDQLSESAMIRLRHSYAVAYAGDFKVVIEWREGVVQTFNLATDSREKSGLERPRDMDAVRAYDAARGVAERIVRARSDTVDPALIDRLRSWGY